MLLELHMPLRGTSARVQLLNTHIPDEDTIIFQYRVFVTDVEDDSEAEIMQVSPAEHDLIWSAINHELQELCS